jgi:hypothetical protein
MAFDASAVVFRQFMLHQGAKKPRGGPAVFIGLPGKEGQSAFMAGMRSSFSARVSRAVSDNRSASCFGPPAALLRARAS